MKSTMKNENESIRAGLAEARAIIGGKRLPARVTYVEKLSDGTMRRTEVSPKDWAAGRPGPAPRLANAMAARRKLRLSQPEFAALLGVSVATLRNWEQHRVEPSGAAAVLLRVAERNPEAVLEAVA